MIYTIDELCRRIVPVTCRYGIQAVYLFGSYARNEATDSSDVDILIDRKGSSVRGMFEMGSLYNDLQRSVEKKIDLVTMQMLSQKSTIERIPSFVSSIKKDMVPLYE